MASSASPRNVCLRKSLPHVLLIRIQLQRALQNRDRFLAASLLQEQGAERRQPVHRLGSAFQVFLEGSFRFRQPPGADIAHPERHP
jgi:hypothetical protein